MAKWYMVIVLLAVPGLYQAGTLIAWHATRVTENNMTAIPEDVVVSSLEPALGIFFNNSCRNASRACTVSTPFCLVIMDHAIQKLFQALLGIPDMLLLKPRHLGLGLHQLHQLTHVQFLAKRPVPLVPRTSVRRVFFLPCDKKDVLFQSENMNVRGRQSRSYLERGSVYAQVKCAAAPHMRFARRDNTRTCNLNTIC